MEPVRSSALAYDRYLQGMDASMRQKVALTAAHLLAVGTVADMGMGSGSGSYALASLYPSLRVIGVDRDQEMVVRARERHVLPNLEFRQGDIATRTFEPGSLDAILDSSVLHHVTSFQGYDRAAARRAVEVQVEALAPEGVIVVRDFVDPGPELVWLDVRTDDGEDDTILGCSTAALFERFATEFRILEPVEMRGFAYRRVDDAPKGWARFEVSHTLAAEFVLRKDYRQDWELEVQEEYTFATQKEIEGWFQALGLRILASTPLRNPWIVRNRYRDRVRLTDLSGRALDPPPTNLVVVGQKVRDGEGVRFVESPAPASDYLRLTHWRRTTDDRVFDLARRPNLTVDIIPFYLEGGQLFVLARRSYPRPIATAGGPSIDGSTPSPWLSEPLAVVLEDEPIGETVSRALERFGAIGEAGIRSFHDGATYYPSPGGLQEEVRSIRVEVAPTPVDHPLDHDNGFSTGGTLRALEARQLLRAAQVGALPDARLEHNVYDLLLDRGLGVGPWIGEAITLPAGGARLISSVASLIARPSRRLFRRAAAGTAFLHIVSSRFDEVDHEGRVVGSRTLARIEPKTLSLNTVSVAVLARVDGTIVIAVDDDDLPAVQSFTGNSSVWVAPAWRLPREVPGIDASRAWITLRLEREYGLRVQDVFELGGRYHPSAGATPEVVWPLAVVADPATLDARPLTWIPLDDAVRARDHWVDGHLRTVVLRAAHALGLLAV